MQRRQEERGTWGERSEPQTAIVERENGTECEECLRKAAEVPTKAAAAGSGKGPQARSAGAEFAGS